MDSQEMQVNINDKPQPKEFESSQLMVLRGIHYSTYFWMQCIGLIDS